MKTRKCRRRQWRRGQGMVEYALIVSFLLGGLVTMSIIFLPTMIRAYDIYYRSYYAILNLPIP
ncbi:MAG: hypothetical protein GYA21_00445 [Myxococcales bacterium]|nr:hypothetical protein [Myxococcales bacterium]